MRRRRPRRPVRENPRSHPETLAPEEKKLYEKLRKLGHD
jgi:hypothetical protein